MQSNLTVCTYNVHGWRTRDFRPNEKAICDLFSRCGPDVDVLCLQEVHYSSTPENGAHLWDEDVSVSDASCSEYEADRPPSKFNWYGDKPRKYPRANQDESSLAYVAQRLGLPNIVYASAYRDDFGNAILSKYPIKRHFTYRTTTRGEQRSMLGIEISVPSLASSASSSSSTASSSHLVQVLCLHLDDQSESRRLNQIKEMLSKANKFSHTSAMAAGRPIPRVLTGDFNAYRRKDFSQEKLDDVARIRARACLDEPKFDVMSYVEETAGWLDAWALWNSADEDDDDGAIDDRPKYPDYTCYFYTRIDFQLCDQKAVEAGAIKPVSLQRIAENKDIRHCSQPSDHFPILCKYRIQ